VLSAATSEDGLGPTLTLGAGFERVTDDYYSLTHPGMLAGREDISVTADYLTQSLTLSFYGLHQTTNPEDKDTFVTDRILSFNFSGFYTPWTETAPPAWLGTPSLTFGVGFYDVHRIETPPLLEDPADLTSWTTEVGVSTVYDDWNWSLTYAFDTFDDKSASGADATSHTIRAAAGWTVSDRVTLDGEGAVSFFDDALTGDRTDYMLRAGITAQLIPAKLALNAGYIANFTDGDAGIEGGTLTTELAWTIRSGVALVGSAGFSHGDSASLTDDDVEAYAGIALRVATPFSR